MKKVTLKFAEINRDIFEAICDGRKRVETRAATVKYRDIVAGDTVILSCGEDRIEKHVIKSTIFPSIGDMLKVYTVKEIHPNVVDEAELYALYLTFSGYEEKLKEFGIIALELDQM